MATRAKALVVLTESTSGKSPFLSYNDEGDAHKHCSSPIADGRHPFSPLHAVQEVDEIRPAPEPPRSSALTGWPVANTDSHYSQDQFYQNPKVMTTSAFYASDSSSDPYRGPGAGSLEQDRTPLTADAPRPQNEEYYGGQSSRAAPVDPNPDASSIGVASSNPYEEDLYEQYPGPRRGGGGGALWQQNRMTNRNLTWM